MIDLNKEYFIYDDDGNYVNVLPMDKCLQSLKQRLIDQDGILSAQKKMISEMDQNSSPDARIEELQKQINDMHKVMSHSFIINNRNWKLIEKWTEEHDKKHKDSPVPTAGERYIYEFLPTGIITCGTCRCMLCKESFNFYED